jgi:hypothetical protein
MGKKIKFRIRCQDEVYYSDPLIISNGVDGGPGIYAQLNDCSWADCSSEIQRFTGKKDVNGSEIYEGDILEYLEGVELGDFTKCNGVVVYDEISCAFGIAPDADSDSVNYFWEGTVKGFKVVGNIFEGEK